ncbi:MAG: glycosyltransferase, partial [Clostridiaceae bacterium]
PDELIKTLVDKLHSEGKYSVGYAGGISVSNAMDDFIQAMVKLKEKDNVAAIIIGEGILKDELQNIKSDQHLDNVHFVGSIAKDKVNPTLGLLDALYIGSKKSKLYEYGVSANKIFDYLNVGLPIVNAFDTMHSPMNYLGNTIECIAEDPISIADGILKSTELTKEERERIKCESSKFVVENHNYDDLAKRFSGLFR